MTLLERRWLDAITQIGCIVCLLFFKAPGTPGAVHHLLRGGRRIGHLDTICLCDPGHHQNGTPPKISRHPYWSRFEQAYGTEESLLARTRLLVADRFGFRITTTDDLSTPSVPRSTLRSATKEAHETANDVSAVPGSH